MVQGLRPNFESILGLPSIGSNSSQKRRVLWLWISFPGGSDSKESACNAGDLCSIPGSGKSPGEANDNPLQYSCLEDPGKNGQRSLVGYSPWGGKESDTT